MDGTGLVGGEGRYWPGGGRGGIPLKRNRIARSGQDSIGRVAADREAGADYAGHAESCGCRKPENGETQTQRRDFGRGSVMKPPPPNPPLGSAATKLVSLAPT